MADSLAAMRGRRLLVVGDAMLDRFVEGAVARLSPEAPVPVFRPGRTTLAPGGAGNVAANLKALGCAPLLVCALGRDEAAASFRQLADFEVLAVTGAPGTTTVKERLLAEGHHLLRIDHEARQDIRWGDLAPLVQDALARVDGVVLSDYGKGLVSEETAEALIREAHKRELPVVVDPAAKPAWPYRGADVLTPNRPELALAWGEGADAAGRALDALGLRHLVVTRGAEGLTLFDAKGRCDYPTEAVAVRELAGAGDTVTAVIGACLAAGIDMDQACRLANRAAGLAVRKSGTAAVSAAELRGAATENKVVSAERLGQVAADWRAAGLRVGFANGVFDLFHPGHLHLLRQAKTACDRLVVALNDDASAAQAKPGRPIQELAARLAVVGALDCVDLVTSFSEATPVSLIAACRPDVLVKGGDYREEEVVGRDFAKEVLIVPLLPGHSTTASLDKLRRAAA